MTPSAAREALAAGAMATVHLEADGLQWRVRTWGRPELPAVVFLHGFTWDGASWEPVAQALCDSYFCVAPDLPGHGATSWPEPTTQGSFDRVVESLAAALRLLDLASPRLVGYSMGGRLALCLALMAALPIERLVLVGASAGLASDAERRQRAVADAELADYLVDQGMTAFLDRWMALPLFSTFRALDPALLMRLNSGRATQDPRGLAASLHVMGTGSQPCVMEALGDLDMPTLLVVGDQDAKFGAIATEMLARLPQGRLEALPACGHSVPFERPAELAARLSAFFTEAP